MRCWTFVACIITSTPIHAQELTALAEQLSASVVVLSVDRGHEQSKGTGFFISETGQIATNHHVIEDAQEIMARTQNGETYRIESILARDEENDLAVIQAEAGQYVPLRLGRSAAKAGDRIVVYGNPLGLDFSLSEGIISANRGANELSEEGLDVAHLQISAPISFGSSGSPVMNLSGEVVGVVTSMKSNVTAQNLNFAAPVRFLSALRSMADRDPRGEPINASSGWQTGFVNLALSVAFFLLIFRYVLSGRLRSR